MRTIILLAIVTLIIHFGIPLVSTAYGPAVKARFIERLKTIPGDRETDGATDLDAVSFSQWVKSHAFAARGYAFPVLFPLDFLFLVALSSFLGFGSVALARNGFFISSVPVWVWWVLPLLYLVADFCEDTTLACLFTWPDAITPGSFGWLQTLTFVKIKAVIAAIVQFVAVGAVAIATSIAMHLKA
jgi:hypothetical protein